jgi:acyl dehydratase
VRFVDLTPGAVIRTDPRIVTAKEIVEFASRYDPQWFHTDVDRAGKGRWKGLIASGWHTCSIAMRLVVDGALGGSESFGSPGLEYLKWLAPVRPGDALTVHAEVLDTRRSERNATLGVLRWRWQLVNEAGAAVLDLVATSLFDLAQATGDDARTSSTTRGPQ